MRTRENSVSILSELKSTSTGSLWTLGELSEKRIDLIQSTVHWRKTCDDEDVVVAETATTHWKWKAFGANQLNGTRARQVCAKDPVKPNVGDGGGGTLFSLLTPPPPPPPPKCCINHKHTLTHSQQFQQWCIIENLINGSLTTATDYLLPPRLSRHCTEKPPLLALFLSSIEKIQFNLKAAATCQSVTHRCNY